jgi:hypothetical protein
MPHDRRDPLMQFRLPNGRRKDDDPPLAHQAVSGFPRLPDDAARAHAPHRHGQLVVAMGTSHARFRRSRY